jgi:hypothetical protein
VNENERSESVSISKKTPAKRGGMKDLKGNRLLSVTTSMDDENLAIKSVNAVGKIKIANKFGCLVGREITEDSVF